MQVALRTIITNVLQQPEEPRFRSLSPTNAAVAKRVLPATGALELLRAIGFTQQAPGGDLVLAAGEDVAVLRHAAAELDALIDRQPRPEPQPEPEPEPCSGSAGSPLPLHSWGRRYMLPCNRGRGDAPDGRSDAALRQLFQRPTLDEFLSRYRGARPCIIALAGGPESRAPSGTGWPQEAGPCEGGTEAAWVQRAAQLAAAAASGDDGKMQKRLVVVNPLDVERRKHDPALERALATDEAERSAAFEQLSQRQLVAVRDVHTDEHTVARLRDAFAQAFDCPVTTNLYMNGVGSAGFVEHHDAHEVFAVQVHGTKRWSVGPPTVTNPSHRYRWRDEHHSPPGAMTEFVTRAGEALYIPLGWRHFAAPTGGEEGAEPSVHVTMGVHLPRWGDLLEAMLHQVSTHSSLTGGPSSLTGGDRCAQMGADGETAWLRQPLDPHQGVDVAEVQRRLRQLADAAPALAQGAGVALAGGARVSVS